MARSIAARQERRAPARPEPINPEGPLELNSEGECFRLLKMKAIVAKKAKNEAELLDQATGNLLRAVKQKMLKKQGRVDLSKLRKEGYSERFLDKLERA